MEAREIKPGRYVAEYEPGRMVRVVVDFDAHGILWAVECDPQWRPKQDVGVWDVELLGEWHLDRISDDVGSSDRNLSGNPDTDDRSLGCCTQAAQHADESVNGDWQQVRYLSRHPPVGIIAASIVSEPTYAAAWRAVVRHCVQESSFPASVPLSLRRSIGDEAGRHFVGRMQRLASLPRVAEAR